MNQAKFLFLLIAALAFASCSSDPQWADEEAYEKTVQLNEQYGPLMVGTWYYENISDTQRYFERLTFQRHHRRQGATHRLGGRGTERHVHRDVAAEILESRGQQRREAQLPATDRHLQRYGTRLHGLLLRPHLRLCRCCHPPHPRLLRQRPRRLDQLSAWRDRTRLLKKQNLGFINVCSKC